MHPGALADVPISGPKPRAATGLDLEPMRRAQAGWARTRLSDRLALIRRVRHRLAERGPALAEAARIDSQRPIAEKMVAEVLPLADACRFLEREAASILATRVLGRRGRPTWLTGVDAEVRREPLGVVLLVGPSNYPLLIPGVQAVQALVAGNAVLWKPGAGGGAVGALFLQILIEVGLDPNLVRLLPETVEATNAAIAAGVDKVVLTGSAEAGQAVLARLAPELIPATMELSGSDVVIVLPGADLELVARSVNFGLRFNGAETCIAPRRLFVGHEQAASLERHLAEALGSTPSRPLRQSVGGRALPLLREAIAAGAKVVAGDVAGEVPLGPIVLADVPPELPLLRTELFGPILSIVGVADEVEALRMAGASPHALGASIFGDPAQARDVAGRVRAGSVVINDLIVPTADPRLPFGGRGRSGFGLTRGPEGLLEMTAVKTISVRNGRARPHLDPLGEADVEVARAYLAAAHGDTLRARARGLQALLRSLMAKSRRPVGPGQGQAGGRRGE